MVGSENCSPAINNDWSLITYLSQNLLKDIGYYSDTVITPE
jgi:hypothetical protein